MVIQYHKNLWDDFKKGHHSAFTLIYNQHIDMLYAYASKISSDKSLVKDSIQEVFIDLFERREEIRKPEALKFYLFKSLKNNLFGKLQKERKTGDFEIEEFESFEIEYSIEDQLIEQENSDTRYKRIAEALKKLSPKQKEIIYLRYNQGFDFKKISGIMNIQADSAKKQAYRALAKLRESLERDYLQLLLLPLKKN